MLCERCGDAEASTWKDNRATCGSCARGSQRVRTKEPGGTLLLLVERGTEQERYLRDLLSSGETMPFCDSNGGQIIVRVTAVRAIERKLGFVIVSC